MSDIIERLHRINGWHHVPCPEEGQRRLSYHYRFGTNPIALEAIDEIKHLRAEIARLREALHNISLCSQNSMSSKEECGRIARAALAKQ